MLNICHCRDMWLRALSSPAFSWLFLMFLIIFWFLLLPPLLLLPLPSLLLITILSIFVQHFIATTNFQTDFCYSKLNNVVRQSNKGRIQNKKKIHREIFCAIFKYKKNWLIEIFVEMNGSACRVLSFRFFRFDNILYIFILINQLHKRFEID